VIVTLRLAIVATLIRCCDWTGLQHDVSDPSQFPLHQEEVYAKRAPSQAVTPGSATMSLLTLTSVESRINTAKSERRSYWIVTCLGLEPIPFATTSILLAPVSALAGISTMVDTIVLPVAMAIVLWPWVRA